MSDKKLDILELYTGDYKTHLNRMHLSRKKWSPKDPGKILSFMPGTVVEYKVKAGDRVKTGDTLMLFKAMKMDNRILSPIDGVVKSLNAVIGENVPKNFVLMELD